MFFCWIVWDFCGSWLLFLDVWDCVICVRFLSCCVLFWFVVFWLNCCCILIVFVVVVCWCWSIIGCWIFLICVLNLILMWSCIRFCFFFCDGWVLILLFFLLDVIVVCSVLFCIWNIMGVLIVRLWLVCLVLNVRWLCFLNWFVVVLNSCNCLFLCMLCVWRFVSCFFLCCSIVNCLMSVYSSILVGNSCGNVCVCGWVMRWYRVWVLLLNIVWSEVGGCIVVIGCNCW